MTQEEKERYVALGRHLKALREARGLTQKALGHLAKMSDSQIRAIENRTAKGRYQDGTLPALSRALGKDENYLDDYLRNPPTEGPGEPKTMGTQPPAQTDQDLMNSAVKDIVTACLNELVVPLLQRIERQTHPDVMYNNEDPDDSEQDPPAPA